MATLHPTGVNHLAIATRDMKLQLEFWTDVLGCPLKALYWMHGGQGAFHGFVELSATSYIAFVQHPDNPKDIEYGVTHAGNPGGPVTAGTTQHIALHLDTLQEVLALRDRIRSRGVQVVGPIDHGFVQSMYFAGPEGLTLEVCCGAGIDERAWVDPDVVELCGISASEVARFESPESLERPVEAVPQPLSDVTWPQLRYPPGVYENMLAMTDQEFWDVSSETTPPVGSA